MLPDNKNSNSSLHTQTHTRIVKWSITFGNESLSSVIAKRTDISSRKLLQYFLYSYLFYREVVYCYIQKHQVYEQRKISADLISTIKIT